MIPCTSLTETSILASIKERAKEMRVFGCRVYFWTNNNNIANIPDNKGKATRSCTKSTQ